MSTPETAQVVVAGVEQVAAARHRQQFVDQLTARSTAMPKSDQITSHTGANASIRVPCGAAAPLVVNGAAFVGCSLSQGHEGRHEVNIKW